MPDEPKAPDPQVVDAFMTVAVAAQGGTLDEEGRERLRQNVERLCGAAAALDAYPLTNADEPDASFRAVERMDQA
jgi:hypothetical protein